MNEVRGVLIASAVRTQLVMGLEGGWGLYAQIFLRMVRMINGEGEKLSPLVRELGWRKKVMETCEGAGNGTCRDEGGETRIGSMWERFFKLLLVWGGRIVSTVRTQFNWYKLLISLDDPHKREYYEHETLNNHWMVRELGRQIHSGLYERLLLSNDKESVLAVARKERHPECPQEIIKSPVFLEFLGLESKPHDSEKWRGTWGQAQDFWGWCAC